MTTEIQDQTSKLGFTITGSAETGQHVTLNEANTLSKIFGTKHPELASGFFRHCLKVLNAEESSDNLEGNDERVFIVGIISEIAPRDAVEQMLAVQMSVTHVAMIRAGRSMAYAKSLEGTKAHNNAYTKLARTFAAQVEALRKHRNGGKQTVTVQHVNVENGGQAVVGNVRTGEGRT